MKSHNPRQTHRATPRDATSQASRGHYSDRMQCLPAGARSQPLAGGSFLQRQDAQSYFWPGNSQSFGILPLCWDGSLP